MSTTWSILETLFRESKQYRGDNGTTLADLRKLVEAIAAKGKLIAGGNLSAEGGLIQCEYSFDPGIWGKWYTSQDIALTLASSDKDVVGQYAGRSQGGMSFKTNWSHKVVNVPGKARTDFERLPSTMDRYDVLMQGEVAEGSKLNHKTKRVESVRKGTLYRVAYSPSIGSSEERRARLLALIAGQEPGALARRPQPERPNPPADSAQDKTPAQPVPRVGQNLKRQDEE